MSSNQPTWTTLFEKYGMPTQQSTGPVTADPFQLMATQARQWEQTVGPASRISITMSTASDDYNKQRYSVTVTCPCPTTEACLTFTTEATFLLTRQLLNSGAQSIGLPPLQE